MVPEQEETRSPEGKPVPSVPSVRRPADCKEAKLKEAKLVAAQNAKLRSVLSAWQVASKLLHTAETNLSGARSRRKEAEDALIAAMRETSKHEVICGKERIRLGPEGALIIEEFDGVAI